MRVPKFLRRAATTFVAAFVVAAAGVAVAGLVDSPGRADVAIVPATRVLPGGRLTGRLAARCTRALEVWRAGEVGTLFVSGGIAPDGQDEAACMKRWLLARGVPDSAIVTDPLGADSWRTVRDARRWMAAHHRTSAILVTQGFHVPRMRLACARLGVAPVRWTHAHWLEWRDAFSIAREVPALVAYALRDTSRE